MSGVKLTPEWALKAAQAVQDAVISECEAERFLYMLPTGHGKETMDRHIALALSQAYERGQESMRERAAEAVANLPIQIYRDDGIGPAGRSCKPATFGDAVEAIRSLPIEQEGGE